MLDKPGEVAPESEGSGCCLDISLQSVASHIRKSDGTDIPFARAVLRIRNISGSDVHSLAPHATLGQEGGTEQDVSASLLRPAQKTLPAGDAVTWDVYDQLITAHPGAASKIHMFGYRAALNWRFDLAVWAAYRPSDQAAPERTAVSRWSLRWRVPDPGTGAVELTID